MKKMKVKDHLFCQETAINSLLQRVARLEGPPDDMFRRNTVYTNLRQRGELALLELVKGLGIKDENIANMSIDVSAANDINITLTVYDTDSAGLGVPGTKTVRYKIRGDSLWEINI